MGNDQKIPPPNTHHRREADTDIAAGANNTDQIEKLKENADPDSGQNLHNESGPAVVIVNNGDDDINNGEGKGGDADDD